MPAKEPSHLREDRSARRPPWAQWSSAFLCLLSPFPLLAVCAYHPTVVLLLLTVNTPWSPRNVVVALR
jgi:hypothetical protein